MHFFKHLLLLNACFLFLRSASGIFIEDFLISWEQVDPGIKRKIIAYDEKLMVVNVQFDKGAIGAVHQHSHSQISHVESGRFEIEINEVKQMLSAGDAFYGAPNVLHVAVCLEAGVLIDVFVLCVKILFKTKNFIYKRCNLKAEVFQILSLAE